MLAVVGSGVQARAHLRMLPLVRPFAEVRLVARDPSAAARLGVSAGRVEGADVVCLTTGASSPVLRWRGRRAGDPRDLGRLRAAGRRARSRARVARAPVRGDPRRRSRRPRSAAPSSRAWTRRCGTELGAVLAGRAEGRRSHDEITVYKAMGHIAEDAAAAALVYEAALERGLGQSIDL